MKLERTFVATGVVEEVKFSYYHGSGDNIRGSTCMTRYDSKPIWFTVEGMNNLLLLVNAMENRFPVRLTGKFENPIQHHMRYDVETVELYEKEN